ncbi:MAG: restriction endonuclease subunit S [Bacteroidales bacterium]|nr:restriction endonuclease subunit S [Bacteroidales bacterium]
MNIPQGYKQTELGIIPKDWQLQSVGKHCTVKARIGWQGLRSDEYLESGEYGLITSTDIVDGAINWDTCYFVDKSRYIQDPNIIIQEDDTLISKDGTIGKVGIVQNIPFPSTLNSGVFVVRPKLDNVYKKYLAFAFKSVYFQNFINRLTAGSTIVHLYQKDIVKFVFPVPPLAEQRAIAEALSDVDGLIAALDKKIAKKRLLKQGAMQQLLTGKKCLLVFTDKWVEKKLGKISHIKTGGRNGDQAVENGKYPFFVRSQKVYAIDTYSFDGEAILVPGEGGIGNIFHYINGKFDFHQRVYKISDFADEACGKFIYFYMSRYFGEYALSLTVKATVDSLRLPTFEEFVIYMPSDIKEQQAIATILSDMDKEITDLEAQRDKYRLLKSGMMQKLLTGQIRLVKQQAKIVPLGVEVPVVREIPVATHIIAGHIVNRSHKSRGWGRTKLQKSLHLIGYCMQLNLGTEYIRNTAGPDDQQLMNYIDQKFRQYRHVNKVSEKLPDGKTHYSYTPTPMIQDVEMAYEKYPKELREQIDALIDKLNTMDLAGAEILSTLYAVWNNRIIKQEQITDDLLIADFYAWSTHKADFEEARVRKALNYMRDNNIIPVGWGKYIDKRKA